MVKISLICICISVLISLPFLFIYMCVYLYEQLEESRQSEQLEENRQSEDGVTLDPELLRQVVSSSFARSYGEPDLTLALVFESQDGRLQCCNSTHFGKFQD
jgi:hypothetical protein